MTDGLAAFAVVLGVVDLVVAIAAWVRAGEAARRAGGRVHRGMRVRRRRRL